MYSMVTNPRTGTLPHLTYKPILQNLVGSFTHIIGFPLISGRGIDSDGSKKLQFSIFFQTGKDVKMSFIPCINYVKGMECCSITCEICEK